VRLFEIWELSREITDAHLQYLFLVVIQVFTVGCLPVREHLAIGFPCTFSFGRSGSASAFSRPLFCQSLLRRAIPLHRIDLVLAVARALEEQTAVGQPSWCFVKVGVVTMRNGSKFPGGNIQ